jgi:hypothetical protein
MRRGYVLFAVFAVAAIGSYAEAGLGSAAPENPVLTGIQSFVARQRHADMATCTALGKADIQACVRDLSKQRRARLEGAAAAPAETPAGIDI